MTTSSTKPEGQSAIASSKVATNSVTAETSVAAASGARTDGPAAAVVVAGVGAHAFLPDAFLFRFHRLPGGPGPCQALTRR